MLESEFRLKGLFPPGPLGGSSYPRERQPSVITPMQMSIGELLERSQDAPEALFAPFGSELVLNVTAHALSQRGNDEERLDCYNQLKGFLGNPASREAHEKAFYVEGKSFRTRPPLRLAADSHIARPYGEGPYAGKIFQADPSVSLYVVVENEYGPIASMGLNDFGDGVDVNYVQGVKGRKAAEDLNRLGNWRERLFQLAEDYAVYRGFDYAMITPGSERLWLHPQGFTKERAQSIYDRYAQNNGYTYNRPFKRFIKPLPSTKD